MSGSKITYRAVPAADFADTASHILTAAWPPPAIHYSPAYLRWQLSFPAPWPLPAVAAFDGTEAVGFAAATCRRVRCGDLIWHAPVVSFVAVHPGWQNRGIATGLYQNLLPLIEEVPLLTFAVPSSAGERALTRAYASAGFLLSPFGSYPSHTYLAREVASGGWAVEPTSTFALLGEILSSCASDTSLLWHYPDEAELLHYRKDPRPRQLLLLHSPEATTPAGAAWVVQAEIRNRNGDIQRLATIDYLFLPRTQAAGLPALFYAAASITGASAQPPMVSAPNLAGFSPEALRAAGIRKTGAGFQGYLCGCHADVVARASGTTIEIV